MKIKNVTENQMFHQYKENVIIEKSKEFQNPIFDAKDTILI